MLIIPIEEAQVGMKLAAPVQHPENPAQELLKRGFVLDDKVLDRLRAMSTPFLYVDYPGLDDLDKHLAPLLSPERQAVYQTMKSSIAHAQGRTRAAVPYGDYYKVTRDFMTMLLTQGPQGIYMDQMSAMGGDEVAHATAVAHLSLVVGMRLEMYLITERKRLSAQHAKDVVNLGVAAMLHDIGKTKLPESLRTHTITGEIESDVLRDEWETHTRLGYEMIRGAVESTAASAVLHHHQRFDSTGFPKTEHVDGTIRRLEGKSIHIFARILCAADLFDRLTSPMKGARRQTNLEVHHKIRTQYASWLDPTVLQTIQCIAPAFLPGVRVMLSDGSEGIIVDVKANDPHNPLVKLLNRDAPGVTSPPIDLRMPGAPTIVVAAGIPVAGLLANAPSGRAA